MQTWDETLSGSPQSRRSSDGRGDLNFLLRPWEILYADATFMVGAESAYTSRTMYVSIACLLERETQADHGARNFGGKTAAKVK